MKKLVGYIFEKAAKRESELGEYDRSLESTRYRYFIEGAKWQQKQMYSEEDARKIWHAGQEYWKTSGESITFEELIAHLKKIKKYDYKF